MVTEDSRTAKWSFDDFPPEIRLNVYANLFSGLTIIVRAKDETTINDESGTHNKINIYRDRAMGLNVLFASKACMAEGKPCVLSRATFDVDLHEMRALEESAKGSVKTIQGFAPADIKLVRSLNVPTVDLKSFSSMAAGLEMPQLLSVTINVERPHRSFISFSTCETLALSNGVSESLVLYEACLTVCMFRVWTRKKSTKDGEQVSYILKRKCVFGDREVVSHCTCFDYVC